MLSVARIILEGFYSCFQTCTAVRTFCPEDFRRGCMWERKVAPDIFRDFSRQPSSKILRKEKPWLIHSVVVSMTVNRNTAFCSRITILSRLLLLYPDAPECSSSAPAAVNAFNSDNPLLRSSFARGKPPENVRTHFSWHFRISCLQNSVWLQIEMSESIYLKQADSFFCTEMMTAPQR